jgi:hypothetical protein
MANTYDSGLVQEILHDTAITTLGTVCANVDKFSHQVEIDPLKPLSTVNVPLVTAGSAVITNGANFEVGDSTVGNVQVTMAHKSVPFHATAAEMNAGHRVKNLLTKNLQVLGNAIQDIIFAPLTTTNFGTAGFDDTAANFTSADLPTIWTAAKEYTERNLWLDGAYYAKLLPTNAESFRPGETGAYGFDSINVNNRWDGAGAKVIGVVADRSAVAVASGEAYMPENVRNDLSGMESITLPNGIVISLCSWVSRATRAEWCSVDVMIGAAAGDTTAAEVIEDGTA